MTDTLAGTSTIQPQKANLRVSNSVDREIDDVDRVALATDLQSIWNAVTSAREAMDENLKAYSALYEMEVVETNWPWVGAANLILPIIPAELDTMKANIASQVFVQRLIIVTPGDDDPDTAHLAPIVEKYYNAEIRRIRADGKTPIDHFKNLLHLGLRDGGGPCDVLFTERIVPKMIITDEPKIVDDNVVIGGDGHPETERVMTRITETVREVNIFPHLLKEWFLDPDESVSINTALGQLTILWMTEKDLREKIKEGTFREKDVEEALAWVPQGTSDVASDQQESYDKDAGGQINIGQGQGALVSKFFKNRGPLQVIRLFSDQFDMDDDGTPEKNIFWFYPRTPLVFGWTPYEYADERWPTFCWSPLPRPDRPYGYSLCERLADLTADACAGRNQRRNYIDLYIMPLLLQREGDTIRDHDRAFYPGAPWIVEDVDKSIKWFQPNALSPDSFQDNADLNMWVSKLTGQSAPATGAQSSGRRTATETKQQNIAQTLRSSDIAMDFRAFLRQIMQFWHKLNKQYLGADQGRVQTEVSGDLARAYGDEKGGTLTLPPEILSRNFNIDIAGLSDPVDASSRRTEWMAALGVIAQVFPWIVSDPEKSFELATEFFNTFNFSAIERFTGTKVEATQRKQQAEAQAQAQAQLGGAGAPSQPGQNGHPPPHPPTPAAQPGAA